MPNIMDYTRLVLTFSNKKSFEDHLNIREIVKAEILTLPKN
jgi:hypothetical protein